MVDFTALAAPFPANKISWRVGSTTQDKKKGLALAYVDARDVMERLDEVCGAGGWQCRYPHAGAKTCCDIGLLISEQWVWKSDGAGDTDFEGDKGAFSDAFKRAAVRWGVGRYLYGLPTQWVEIEQRGRSYAIKKSELDKLGKAITPSGGNRIHGPLKVTDLKARMREFAGDLSDVSDDGTLVGLLNGYQPVLDQCQRDLPAWWFGDGNGVDGAMARIEARRKELTDAESLRAGMAVE